VKDEVFKNDEYIMVKRIYNKATNMKKQWRETPAMRERPGWGVSEGERFVAQNND